MPSRLILKRRQLQRWCVLVGSQRFVSGKSCLKWMNVAAWEFRTSVHDVTANIKREKDEMMSAWTYFQMAR